VIHKEGFGIILTTLAIFALINAVVIYFWQPAKPIQIVVVLLSLIMIGLVVQFFRNPTRNTPIDINHVIAPCDGKVVVIEEVEENEYFKGKRLQVSIFMSPLNVHVNRNPIGGEVKYAKYHPGQYLVAWHPKSSELNERTTIVIKDSADHEVLFRQIAGAVARRICYYVKPGDYVKQGEEFGFIKFGSRMDIFLPIGTQVNVKIGDKTAGGETLLARFSQ
jgi:phosphatidylserine decarboxylase